MIFEKEFELHDFDSIVALTDTDITEEILDRCFEIDREFYEDSYYWNISELRKAIKEFGQFCFVYIDKEERTLIGYSFWFPIKTDVFNEFIKKKEMLLDIKPEYCLKFRDSKEVNLFLGGEAFMSGYNIREMHLAIEDLLQRRILELMLSGIKVKYIAMESCCKYDEEFLLPKLRLSKSVKKDKSTFYYDEYSPDRSYTDSKYVTELKKYY